MHLGAQKDIVEYFAMFEGGGKKNPITWMYLDERGLVTTGVGLLFDPLEANKFKVKFYRRGSDGKASDIPAGDAELKAEFDSVKKHTQPSPKGGLMPEKGYEKAGAFAPITSLRIQDSDSGGSSSKMVKGIDAALKREFGPDYEDWPADVQVAVVQMAYAGGLEARRKDGLHELLRKRDWYSASDFAWLSNPQKGKKGYVTYNRALPILMMNGWIVDQTRKLDMRNFAPTDHTRFYGVRERLWVQRWFLAGLADPKIYPTDLVTGTNYWGWVKRAQTEDV